MPSSRYNQEELWDRVSNLYRNNTPFFSVAQKKKYTITSLDESSKVYQIEYESGRSKSVPLRDLYAVYAELYRLGELPRNCLRDPTNGERIFGHNRYSHAPGATIYGILPALDDYVQIAEGGDLIVKTS